MSFVVFPLPTEKDAKLSATALPRCMLVSHHDDNILTPLKVSASPQINAFFYRSCGCCGISSQLKNTNTAAEENGLIL